MFVASFDQLGRAIHVFNMSLKGAHSFEYVFTTPPPPSAIGKVLIGPATRDFLT